MNEQFIFLDQTLCVSFPRNQTTPNTSLDTTNGMISD